MMVEGRVVMGTCVICKEQVYSTQKFDRSPLRHHTDYCWTIGACIGCSQPIYSNHAWKRLEAYGNNGVCHDQEGCRAAALMPVTFTMWGRINDILGFYFAGNTIPECWHSQISDIRHTADKIRRAIPIIRREVDLMNPQYQEEDYDHIMIKRNTVKIEKMLARIDRVVKETLLENAKDNK